MENTHESALAAAEIVADAQGKIIGKTRLQKAAYFLESLGVGAGFPFYYKHYGPYSDELSSALHYAKVLGLTNEETKKATWGGEYVIYSSGEAVGSDNPVRHEVLSIANDASPVALELAATALFLKSEGSPEPWTEVSGLKPSKASAENLRMAHEVYRQIRELNAPKRLPDL